jgi:mannan endo-1,4-beta-mannosidase
VLLILPIISLVSSSCIQTSTSITRPPTPLPTPTIVSTTTSTPIAKPQSPSIYYGAFVHVGPAGSGLPDFATLDTFEHDAKKRVALYMWFQRWDNTYNSAVFNVSWMNTTRSRGSIPVVTWTPHLPDTSQYTTVSGKTINTHSLERIIGGEFDSYISQWAEAAKAWGHPFFLRFAHEMNGQWQPWSEQKNGNQAGLFVKMWRHVHDIFTSVGATNVSWVWAPYAFDNQTSLLKELYPGDAYVDWVGMDAYNGTEGQWQTFTVDVKGCYTSLTSFTTKPIMIAEMASQEQSGNKAAWITDAFTVQLPYNYPNIKAFVWFNTDKERDWRIESSPAAQNAFAAAMQSPVYATNHYGNLNISPIPVPEDVGSS